VFFLNNMISINYRRGFSLIETLLTISIIGSLAATAISSLGPGLILGKSRNVQRWANLNDLLGAITAFTIENDGQTPPNVQLPSIPGPAGFSGSYVLQIAMNSARAVVAVDMDNDGDIDVVGTGSQGNDKDVSWWEQSGEGPNFTWTLHTVDSSNWKGYDVTVADMDGDLLLDIISVDKQGRNVAWWQNQGGTPPTFGSRVEIEGNYRYVRSVDVADMDGDLDNDVIAGSYSVWTSPVKVFKNDGNPLSGNWYEKNVEWFPFLYTMSEVHAVDIDGDDDMDVLGGGYYLRPYWWENDGNPWQNGWTRYQIDSSWTNMRGIAYGDMDGDLDIDVVGISTSQSASWWENDGNPKQNNWTKHVIASNFGGDSVITSDFDGDGDIDVIGASSGGDKIVYWENTGGGSFAGTYVIVYGDEVNGVNDIYAVDVDNDNDIDIVSANGVADTVTWWMNTSIETVSDPAPIGGIEGDYKPVCKEGVSEVECDANGGVSLDVLIPGHIVSIPVDPLQPEESVLAGYEVRHDPGTMKLYIRAPLAEMDEDIELLGPIGVANCLIWDILNSERTCVLFE
jgi:prepilin-type N-terminal cleavage/methylation domain-containing protein